MAVSSPVWMTLGAVRWPTDDTFLQDRSTEEFDRLDELWDTKWLGDFSEDEESWPKQSRHHRRQFSRWTSDPALGSDRLYSIGKRHPLNCSGDYSELGIRSSSSSSLSGMARSGLLQRVKSWLQLMQDKRRAAEFTNSGPCAVFSDLGIPPYPEDYDWNQ